MHKGGEALPAFVLPLFIWGWLRYPIQADNHRAAGCTLSDYCFFRRQIVIYGLQYMIRIQAMYHTGLFQRFPSGRGAAHTVHSRLHENSCNSHIVGQHLPHGRLFRDLHLLSPFLHRADPGISVPCKPFGVSVCY